MNTRFHSIYSCLSSVSYSLGYINISLPWLNLLLGILMLAPACVAGICSPCLFFLFLGISRRLSFAGPCWVEGKVGPSCGAPKGWRSWPLIPLSPFQQREFPPDAEQGQPGAGRMQNKAVLPFLYRYSQVFCSTVLLKFLKWTPELSQYYFYS